MKKIINLFLLSGLLAFTACDKYLDLQPVGSVIPNTVTEYRALLARAYKNIQADRGMAGFRSDEMRIREDEYDQANYADIERWNDLAQFPATMQFNWSNYYNMLFIANHVIESRSGITEGTPEEVDQLVGEAYLLRAYVHFLLVNLYGQPYTKPGATEAKAVPLKLDTDLEKVLSRNTVGEVYASLTSDIDEARRLINKEEWEKEFSYRFNTASVEAFQSRASLYMGQWQKAWEAAEAVLTRKSSLEDLNGTSPVLPNLFESVENITALEMGLSNTVHGAALAPASFLALYQEGDLRLNLYFTAPNANGARRSVKSGYNKYSSTFRVGEIYLNVAEAAARLNKLPEARTRLLQLMRMRYTPEAYVAKESMVNGMGQETLITEILNERARELAFEGHRWFDLRRTTRPRIEKVLDGKTYVLEQDDTRYTIPIPKEAIAANPGLAN